MNTLNTLLLEGVVIIAKQFGILITSLGWGLVVEDDEWWVGSSQYWWKDLIRMDQGSIPTCVPWPVCLLSLFTSIEL